MTTIKKGRHYPFPGFMIQLPKWVSKKKPTYMRRCFKFTESCLFDLHDEDQWDVNKLFGFSIGWHHKTSFRFGWRPILETEQIEIVAYEYHGGMRQKTRPIHRVEINSTYQFLLSYHPAEQKTEYSILNTKKLINLFEFPYLKKKSGLGYTLGLYFGGNEKAPQDVTILKCRKD